MPELKRKRWGVAVAVSLASAFGCNAILGNEEGHLPSDASGGDGNMSGTGGKGSGGKGSGGAATGTEGGVPNPDAGAGGVPGNEAGAGGEPSGGSGGSPTLTGGTLGTGGKTGTGGAAKGGSGGTVSTGGSGPPIGGGAGQGGANTGGRPTPPGGAPSTGGAGPAACATTEPSSCPTASSVRYCDAGSYRTVSCATRCAEIGFDGTQAMCSNTICMCGAGLDPVCEQGVDNYCSCYTGGCTQQQFTALYVSCYQGGPTALATRCWAEAADCTDGATTCGT